MTISESRQSLTCFRDESDDTAEALIYLRRIILYLLFTPNVIQFKIKPPVCKGPSRLISDTRVSLLQNNFKHSQ